MRFEDEKMCETEWGEMGREIERKKSRTGDGRGVESQERGRQRASFGVRIGEAGDGDNIITR